METYLSLTERHLKSNFEKYERTTAPPYFMIQTPGCIEKIVDFMDRLDLRAP